MLFADYLARWTASVPAPAERFSYGTVLEGGREFPLLGLRLSGARTVLVTAGFHGDEKAGPLTLVEHVAEIVAYAAERGVGLAIYPCVNPSGFEAHVRYNLSGERPNNDFLRYELAPGVWRGELREGERFLRVVPAAEGLPKETAALARELDRGPLPAAALDLHQDNFIHGSLFYAYVFGELATYRPLMARAGSLVPVLRSSIVDSGHEPGSDVRADAEGFIICPDGSITDRYHRAGVPYVAAIETTTETPAALADEINLIWIRGFIDLAAAAG
ncbi:MAG TPA: succinylglutamate desuccinylase/aspartoacylase family protein [Polyangia bacterium]|nr:succinylglutamate desuccinylase/aspartoacylase family protein [Polyangia bacterium]